MGGVSGWTGTVHQKPAQPQLNLIALLEHIFFSMERTEHTLLTELQWFRLWKEKTKLSTQNRWKLINIHIFKVPPDVGLHFLQKKPHFLLAENTDSLELNLSSILFFFLLKNTYLVIVLPKFFSQIHLGFLLKIILKEEDSNSLQPAQMMAQQLQWT